MKPFPGTIFTHICYTFIFFSQYYISLSTVPHSAHPAVFRSSRPPLHLQNPPPLFQAPQSCTPSHMPADFSPQTTARPVLWLSHTMGKDVVTAEDIEEICTTRTENKIFDMVRAVTEKNQRKALDLYNDLLTLREPPMRILFLLSKQFRQMCLAKKMSVEGASQNEIATRLGVPSFAVRNLLTCARA